MQLITITASAVEAIEAAIRDRAIPEQYHLRVGVQRGGCQGLAHQLGFDEQKPNDQHIMAGSVSVVIDSQHVPYLQGLKIDYEPMPADKELYALQGLVFTNPNAVRTCGCGTSFNVI
jgi:iron-sulfur cluster assembly protein